MWKFLLVLQILCTLQWLWIQGQHPRIREETKLYIPQKVWECLKCFIVTCKGSPPGIVLFNRGDVETSEKTFRYHWQGGNGEFTTDRLVLAAQKDSQSCWPAAGEEADIVSQETGHQWPLEERHRSITVEATSTMPDVQDPSDSVGCHRRGGGGSEGGTISDSETCFIRDMWKVGWTLRDSSKKP